MRKENPLPFHLLGDEIVLNYVNSSSPSSFQITFSVLKGSKIVKQPQSVPTARQMEGNTVSLRGWLTLWGRGFSICPTS